MVRKIRIPYAIAKCREQNLHIFTRIIAREQYFLTFRKVIHDITPNANKYPIYDMTNVLVKCELKTYVQSLTIPIICYTMIHLDSRPHAVCDFLHCLQCMRF